MARTIIADAIEMQYFFSNVFVLEIKFVYGSPTLPGHSVTILATAFTSHPSPTGAW